MCDNDFKRICKNLDNRKYCRMEYCLAPNPYTCAKKAVIKYVDNDKDKLYNLKAQALDEDIYNILQLRISIAALIISLVTFVISFLFKDNDSDNFLLMGLVIFGIPIFSYALYSLSYPQSILHWRPYIIVAIDEIESNWKSGGQTTLTTLGSGSHSGNAI